MVGVFGRWGRGKTRFMNEVWSQLENHNLEDLSKSKYWLIQFLQALFRKIFPNNENSKFYRVNFHAWKYQDTPASWAYLYENFSAEFFKTKQKFWLYKKIMIFVKSFNINIKKNGYFPIILFLLSVIIGILPLIKDIIPFNLLGGIKNLVLSNAGLKKLGYFFFALSPYLIIPGSIIIFFKKIIHKSDKRAKDLIKRYFAKTSYSSLLGIHAEIQKELKILLKTWLPEKSLKNGSKIFLFVDDIDRCSENRIIEVIDALRVLLEDKEISKRLVIITAIDERILERAIKWKYHDLIFKDPSVSIDEKLLKIHSITIEYMDKLFISGIKLGDLKKSQRGEIFGNLTKNKIKYHPFDNLQLSQTNPKEKSDLLDIKSSLQTQQANPVQDKSVSKKTANYSLTTQEISQEESELFYTFLRNSTISTPRQIRILYFRYLFAKLIANEFIFVHKNTPLNEQILELIFQYKHSKEISSKIKELEKSIGDHYNNDNITFELLKILEMVVPY